MDALDTVLKVIKDWNRSANLRFSGRTFLCDFQIFNNTYPHLVHIFLTNCDLKPRDISHLAGANAQGRLPKLSTLNISDNPFIRRNLSRLLSQCFPSLHTLILSNCDLQTSDIHSLSRARKWKRLPHLRHLDMSFNYGVKFAWKSYSDKCLLDVLFQERIPTLNTLVVRACDLEYHDLQPLHLFEVIALDISLNPKIRECLFGN